MVTQNPDGSLTFRIYCPHAEDVVIDGDAVCQAAGLDVVVMEPAGDGWWHARLRVAPGDYTFRYIVNGQGSIPDYAAGGLSRDESGAWVSCLHVEEREPAGSEPGARAAATRLATLSEAQLEMLASGQRVELRIDGDPREGGAPPLLLTLTGAQRGPGRMIPRPDRPIERRRESAGRTDRRTQRTRTG